MRAHPYAPLLSSAALLHHRMTTTNTLLWFHFFVLNGLEEAAHPAISGVGQGAAGARGEVSTAGSAGEDVGLARGNEDVPDNANNGAAAPECSEALQAEHGSPIRALERRGPEGMTAPPLPSAPPSRH